MVPAMDRALSPQQRRAGRVRLAKALVLAVASTAAVGWSAHRYLRPSLERSDLRIAVVERGPIEASVAATGIVVPLVQQTLSSPIAAEIRNVLAAPGDRVERGRVIIKLDTTAASVELENLEEQLALMRAELTRTTLQLDDEIRQARSRRELLGVDLESRQVRLDRFEKLGGSGIVSDEELLEARLDLKRTEIEIEQVKAAIASLEARREAELERLRLEQSILEKRTAEQARRVALASVTAPWDGIVTQLLDDEGVAVAEGEALATLAADNGFRIEAMLSDFYAPQLEPGQRIDVHWSGGEASGRLARILPAADEARLKLFVDLAEPRDPRLRANLRVDVDVITAEKADALKLRRGPGVTAAGIQALYVLDGDRAVRRSVQTGVSSSQTIEIVDGLSAGDEVVISDMSAYAHLADIRIR